MSAASINQKVQEAVAAHEAGDYSSALTKLRSAKILLAGKPDTEFDREKLIWDRNAIDGMISELKSLARRSRGIVQHPVIRHLSTRDFGD